MPKSHRAKSHATKQEFYDKDELNDYKIDKWQDPTPVTIQENNDNNDADHMIFICVYVFIGSRFSFVSLPRKPCCS